MSSTAGAVSAALGAAVFFGLASALQHQEARAVETSASPSLLVTLARRPLWLVGIVADVAAVGLQALALGLGSVALVQTLLVAGLPLAAVLSALLAHRGLHRHEVVGLLLCSAGLALLGPALSSTPLGHPPSRADAVTAGVVVAAVVLPLLALRGRRRFGAVFAGAAAGAVIGAASVLLAVAASRVGDWSALFGSWALYGAVAVGLLGLLLAQVAFQTGELGAPLAALSVVEPVVAVLLAVAVLKETLPSTTSARLAAAVGAALAVAGVLALCRDEHRSVAA
ncbi:MAG: integral rane protein [Frankiales bacterium]|nr:integral rane protein [Frankiales bacterium]